MRRVLIVVVAAAVLAALIFLPVGRWTQDLLEWVQGAGALGVAVYAACYILATVLVLPASILTLGAGFAYGTVRGTLLVSPVSVAAASLAWLCGRTVARTWVKRRLEHHAKVAAVDRAVGRGGFKLVMLLRLSPILPFNVLNYALSLTQVSARDYILGSAVGMLPGTLLYVYLGSLVTNLGQLASGKRPSAGTLGYVFYAAGFAATVVATLLIAKFARRELDRQLENAEPPKVCPNA